jgi:hypothetical protein
MMDISPSHADNGKVKNFLLPAFFITAALFMSQLSAQTELDSRASAAAYGQAYVPVPENGKVSIPPLLQGIWQGKDRYVFFTGASTENNDTSVPQPDDMAVVLKTYYGWFYDRAAEPESYGADSTRFLCTATTKEAEHITVTYEPLQTRSIQYDTSGNVIPYDSGVWELVIQYGKKARNVTRIPVAVIGNNLYLDFIIRGRTSDTSVSPSGNPLFGYWQGVSRQKGIRICPQPLCENIFSYYVVDGAVYSLRYWLTTMEYTDALAAFTDGSNTFHVAKHIVSDGNVFTCVTGRSLQIRNIEKASVPLSDYTLDSTGTICAFGAPYLTKVTGKDNAPALMAVVAEANKRRKPDPPPLFPPDDLNWHWDIINLLEKDNAQVQAVRKRQKEFAETNGRKGRIDAVQAAAYSTYTKLENEVTQGTENSPALN